MFIVGWPIFTCFSTDMMIQEAVFPFATFSGGENSPQLLGRYWKQLVWYCKRLMCFSAGRASDFSCIVVRHRGRNINMSRGLSAEDRDCSKGTKIWFADLEISFLFKQLFSSENCFMIEFSCVAMGMFFTLVTKNQNRTCVWHWPSPHCHTYHVVFRDYGLPTYLHEQQKSLRCDLRNWMCLSLLPSRFFVDIYWFNLKVSPGFVPFRTHKEFVKVKWIASWICKEISWRMSGG